MTEIAFAVIYRNHIHASAWGHLAIFKRREDAQAWIIQHGTKECGIRRIKLDFDVSTEEAQTMRSARNKIAARKAR